MKGLERRLGDLEAGVQRVGASPQDVARQLQRIVEAEIAVALRFESMGRSRTVAAGEGQGADWLMEAAVMRRKITERLADLKAATGLAGAEWGSLQDDIFGRGMAMARRQGLESEHR